ncbi:MAG TPA: ammonium transporter [Nitrospiraceae bacterium]|nr:ammonium transporter [Nitrospiraceae bacterium]
MTRTKGHIAGLTGGITAAVWLVLWAGTVSAEETAALAISTKINGADTAWMLASSALVLAMIVPGLALFYGGQVRSKNALATMMQSFAILCLVSLLWILFGYSLAFGPDKGGVIGSLDWAGLSGVGADIHSRYAPSFPHLGFMLFQLLLAALAPALIVGAFAERVRFSALLLVVGLWSIVVYCPLAHWVWGGGWLGKLGVLDFAGGLVVHLSAGAAGLACALVVGKRRGYRTDYLAPHNLSLVLLGTGFLWIGWFGFNGGSARGANAVAIGAVVATQVAAASAALMWMVTEWNHRGKPTLLGVVSGAVAGMATITPGAGYVSPLSAVLFGVAGSLLCYAAIVWKGKFGYDDSLDVVGIHGIGGMVGVLATGLLASKVLNPSGANGLFFGNPAQLGTQALAVCVTMVFSFVGTYVILKVVDGLIGLRVTPDEEATGLDLSQHNERAYS